MKGKGEKRRKKKRVIKKHVKIPLYCFYLCLLYKKLQDADHASGVTDIGRGGTYRWNEVEVVKVSYRDAVHLKHCILYLLGTLHGSAEFYNAQRNVLINSKALQKCTQAMKSLTGILQIIMSQKYLTQEICIKAHFYKLNDRVCNISEVNKVTVIVASLRLATRYHVS